MLHDDRARALHLLQQMGHATGSLAPIPRQYSFSSTMEAAILTAQIPRNVLAASAVAAAVRTQQVAEFTTDAGFEASSKRDGGGGGPSGSNRSKSNACSFQGRHRRSGRDYLHSLRHRVLPDIILRPSSAFIFLFKLCI